MGRSVVTLDENYLLETGQHMGIVYLDVRENTNGRYVTWSGVFTSRDARRLAKLLEQAAAKVDEGRKRDGWDAFTGDQR